MVHDEELLEVAIRGARAGADVLMRYFRDHRLEARIKDSEAQDLVSEADHESEARVLEEIRHVFPDHQVLAEETGYQPASDVDHEWLIDPLDGTANFLQGLPVFCVSVACRRRGVLTAAAVLDPINDQLFTARRGHGAFLDGRRIEISQRSGLAGAFLATGYPFRARSALDLYLQAFRSVFLRSRSIRRCGSAALDLAYTAAGVYDGFFEFRLSPWDFAAGCLLIEEAGGVVTDLDGRDGFFESGNLVAGPRALHADLLTTLQEHVDEATLEELEPVRRSHAMPMAGEVSASSAT